jgi:hypothetical protein
VETTDSGVAWFIAFRDVIPPRGAIRPAAARHDIPPPLPSLHVLHCVWRC